MKFVTFQRRKGSYRGGLLLEGNRLLDLGRAYTEWQGLEQRANSDTQGLINALRGMSSAILEILKIGEEALTDCYSLERAAMDGELEDCAFSITGARLKAPIPEPPLLVHFSVYEEHNIAEQVELSGRDPETHADGYSKNPFFYYGNPFAVCGPSDSIRIGGVEKLDFEFQIAAVISEEVQDAGADDAENAILGYTVACVWVDRVLQQATRAAGFGPSQAKSLAVSMGPSIVTKDVLFDPEDLELAVALNGKALWAGKRGEGRYSFPEMISAASQRFCLPPGTMFLSGAAPGGSLLGTGKTLKIGDVVELSVEGIGSLKHEIEESPVVIRQQDD